MSKFAKRLKRLHGSRVRAVEAAVQAAEEALEAGPRVFYADATPASNSGASASVAADEPVNKPVQARWLRRGARVVSTELGEALVLSHPHAGDHVYGACRLSQGLEVDVAGVLRHVAGLFAQGIDPARLAFLDLETDGLGDGPAFCVGVGLWEAGNFVVHQVALPRLEDERALLRATSDLLAGVDGLVTFNGRSFDVPRLEARYRRAKLPSPLSRLSHVDLLEVCRRVIKGRKSYRLQSLERDVLGVRRHDDVPGREAPVRWARYLRDGDPGPLLDLFEHNRLDIVSLVALLVHVDRPIDARGATDRQPPKEEPAKGQPAKGQPAKGQPAQREPAAEPAFREKLTRAYRLKQRNDEARGRRGQPSSRPAARAYPTAAAAASPPAPSIGERLRALRLEATALMEEGDHAQAARLLHEMAALSPTNPFPLKHLAAYYRASGDESLAAFFEARLQTVSPY